MKPLPLVAACVIAAIACFFLTRNSVQSVMENYEEEPTTANAQPSAKAVAASPKTPAASGGSALREASKETPIVVAPSRAFSINDSRFPEDDEEFDSWIRVAILEWDEDVGGRIPTQQLIDLAGRLGIRLDKLTEVEQIDYLIDLFENLDDSPSNRRFATGMGMSITLGEDSAPIALDYAMTAKPGAPLTAIARSLEGIARPDIEVSHRFSEEMLVLATRTDIDDQTRKHVESALSKFHEDEHIDKYVEWLLENKGPKRAAGFMRRNLMHRRAALRGGRGKLDIRKSEIEEYDIKRDRKSEYEAILLSRLRPGMDEKKAGDVAIALRLIHSKDALREMLAMPGWSEGFKEFIQNQIDNKRSKP